MTNYYDYMTMTIVPICRGRGDGRRAHIYIFPTYLGESLAYKRHIVTTYLGTFFYILWPTPNHSNIFIFYYYQ